MIDPAHSSGAATSSQWLEQFEMEMPHPFPPQICAAEFLRFDADQRERLLPILWQYILSHRDSNDRDELTAVAAATRKYLALMPMEQMGQLSHLLESGHRAVLPLELEIEIAKMIYRNFEVHPPLTIDPHPELAEQLYEMAAAYTHPRVISREGYSAAASLAILAVVAMRSSQSRQALMLAARCPYRWFGEIIEDDLARLEEAWQGHPAAAQWLAETRASVTA